MKVHILDQFLNVGVILFKTFEKYRSCAHGGSALYISETQGGILKARKRLTGARIDMEVDIC